MFSVPYKVTIRGLASFAPLGEASPMSQSALSVSISEFSSSCLAGNILLDRNNTAKIADVGLAKILTTTHGNANLATFLATADLGTFAWAAPEVRFVLLLSSPLLNPGGGD